MSAHPKNASVGKPLASNVNAVLPAEACTAPAATGDVRLRAYYAWEAAGRPAGDGREFWLKAEGESAARNGSINP